MYERGVCTSICTTHPPTHPPTHLHMCVCLLQTAAADLLLKFLRYHVKQGRRDAAAMAVRSIAEGARAAKSAGALQAAMRFAMLVG